MSTARWTVPWSSDEAPEGGSPGRVVPRLGEAGRCGASSSTGSARVEGLASLSRDEKDQILWRNLEA
jgi:hypothetical protein